MEKNATKAFEVQSDNMLSFCDYLLFQEVLTHIVTEVMKTSEFEYLRGRRLVLSKAAKANSNKKALEYNTHMQKYRKIILARSELQQRKKAQMRFYLL